MVNHQPDADHPWKAGKGIAHRDARILRRALREAKRISPDSFRTSVEDIDAKPPDYWMDEMMSSTWAVAECRGNVVDVAAAKRPDPNKDREDQATAQYIESVWIAPDLRRRGLGQRLIKYLLETEHRRNRRV